MAKQDALKASHRIGSWPRWDYDVDAGTLTFSEDGAPKVVADIQVVGSTGPRDWMWGWANEHWPRSVVEDMEKVRAFGSENRIEQLTTEFLTDDDLNSLGWEMTAVAVRVLDAVGAYRPPRDGGGGLFLIYKSIRFVS
ncbi:MAG: hypothetical protein Q7J39_14005 [Phenylobacterium sp.]|nr:DUF6882 domain-containing protein [Phenylobacterium sp.]MDO8801445.1 hypothetical protein [Phenylobacterium sp.]